MSHITENHDALLDYLYEEGDPGERLKIARHLQECAACAVAVLEFQSVRGMLTDWTPPASPSLSAPVDRTRSGWWQRWVPAMHREKLTGPRSRAVLQVAAAILLFASGMAVSQLHVDYRDGSLTLSTRPGAPGARISDTAVTVAGPRENSSAPVPDIAEIVRRVRAEIDAENAPTLERERLLQSVRAMIDESEQRQQRELARRVKQVAGEVDTQHQADVLRIQQDVGHQQEAIEYLVRTAGGSK